MSVIDVLRPHNQEAFQEINKMIESGIKKIAAPRATGSGKTYLMGALAEQYNDDKKLVLEPTRPLLNSIKDKFDEFGITNTDFITYQKLIRMSDEDIAAMDYKLIFLDECHHGTAPIWGEKIDCLMKAHSDSIIFGTSATTIRNDGVNVVETLFDNNAIDELPLSTAIARKVLPCPHYITAIYRLDDEFEKLKKRIEDSTNTKDEKIEFYRKMQEMKIHFEKSYGIPLILNKYIKVRNGRYLVFCKNKKHLDAMRDVVIEWFHTAGIKDIHSYAVYSDYPEKERDYKDFCEDNSDSAKIMFSVNMLNEGLHIEDISGVLMLRTTRSNLVYLQQLGRLLEAGNMDKYLLVFDFVNNFSSANGGVGLLREIKDAIAREKESDPDFDDSGFEDIDTYFVIDQVVEIQEMFREIEGRLSGSWDLYIKALKQYKEREGDCLVPRRYIEILDNGIKVSLGNWVSNMRRTKNGKGKALLTEERIIQLEELGFIWNELKYIFENNIKRIAKYYEQYGKYPSGHTEDLEIKRLGEFIENEKRAMRSKNKYPEWKKEFLEKYLPVFSCKTVSDKVFDKFIDYAKLYNEKYGHMDIKYKDIIDGYKIGIKFSQMRKIYNSNNIPSEKIIRLNDLGICLDDYYTKIFNENIKLAKLAIDRKIVIDKNNPIFQGKNLYMWIMGSVINKYKNNKLSNEKVEIIEKLIGKPLYKINNGNYIKIVDVLDNTTITICKSMSKATGILQKELDKKISVSVLDNRLSGKVTTPYKGRFMFYYATDEEVKKYLEDNKAS